MIVLKQDNDYKLGTWKGVKMLDSRSASMTCPKCGKTCYLNHAIKHDGTVSPSVACPIEFCDFHDFVKLEGWTNA